MKNRPLVTGLYVPGDRPERFDKAVLAGADLVILDLEDAVSGKNKLMAREAVAEWLSTRPHTEGPVLEVRINPGSSEDIAAVQHIDVPFGLRIPKVEAAIDVDAFASLGRPLTVVLETARGVENAAPIAAHPGVTRLALGESDLTSDLGCRSPAILDYARARLLYAARAAHLPQPMLSPYPDIRDLEGFRNDTERGRDLGWFGRTAIHPTQLQVINEVFRPTEDDIEWARQVVASIESGGVATISTGEMVDPAMIGRARAILERASE